MFFFRHHRNTCKKISHTHLSGANKQSPNDSINKLLVPTYSLSNNTIIFFIIPLQCTTRCCAPIYYGGYELTFPLQNGSFIWTTLMAAAAVKTGEPIHRRGASHRDSQPTNCSFEVITQQVRAISSTMPETNGVGRAHLMRSESRGCLPAECQGPLRGHLYDTQGIICTFCSMSKFSLGGY